MTKTAEQLYEERTTTHVKALVVDYLEDEIDNLVISEYLEEEGEDDYDLFLDVRERLHEELDTILQRWLDSDN
jgi:hypothetical protein